jgi:hypothetical protein
MQFSYCSLEHDPDSDNLYLVEGEIEAPNLGAAVDAIRSHLRNTNLEGVGWDYLRENSYGSHTVHLHLSVREGEEWRELGEVDVDDRAVPCIEKIKILPAR